MSAGGKLLLFVLVEPLLGLLGVDDVEATHVVGNRRREFRLLCDATLDRALVEAGAARAYLLPK